MSERKRMTPREIMVGVAVLIVAFFVVFLAAGAFNLALPQWLLSAIAAVIGLIAWFALIGRLSGSK